MLRLLAAAVPFLVPMTSQAASLPVVNPGFEDHSVGTTYNEFTFGPPAGWTLYDPHNIASGGDGPTYFIGTLTPTDPVTPGVIEFFPGGASEGARAGIAFNYFGSGNAGEYGLVQSLDGNLPSNTLQPNTTYTLQVDIGNIASGVAVDSSLYNLDGFPGYRVDLLAGGVVIASDNNSLADTIPEGQFATSVIEFTTGDIHAQMNQPLGIRLVNLNVVDPDFPNADLEVDFDDVRLSAESLNGIPEPGAAMIVAVSFAFHLRRQRRPYR